MLSVLFLAGSLSAPRAPGQANAAPVRWGVVIPAELVYGERASGRVVLDPDDYRTIPGLRTVSTELSLPAGSAAPSLSRFQVQINGASPQPANQPFSFIVGDNLTVGLYVAGATAIPASQLNIALSPASGTLTQPRDFSTSPVSLLQALGVIHGPFGGNAAETALSVGGQRAALIVESQRVLFFLTPEAMKPGAARIDLKDGVHHILLKTCVLGLQLAADHVKLHKGETTAFHVVITGSESIPAEAWVPGPGVVSTLEGLATIRKLQRDFQPPGAASPGVLLLTLENTTPNIITMGKSERLVVTFTRSSPVPFRYDGVLTSKQPGDFNVDAVVIPFLHEQHEENVEQH